MDHKKELFYAYLNTFSRQGNSQFDSFMISFLNGGGSQIGEDGPRLYFVARSKLGLNHLSLHTLPKKPFKNGGVTVMTSARKYFPGDKFAVLYYEKEQ